MEKTMKIEGMMCGHCEASVRSTGGTCRGGSGRSKPLRKAQRL